MTDLDHARLVVSAEALLSPAKAARLLGMRDARAWIEANVQIRYIAGQPRVRWGDVVAASSADAPARPTRRPRRKHRRAEL